MPNLTQRISAAVAGFKRGVEIWGSGTSWGFSRFFFWNKEGKDYRRDAGKVYDNAVVNRIINWYADQIGFASLVVQNRKVNDLGVASWVEDPSHLLPNSVALNPLLDPHRLWYGTILSLLVNDGGAFWYKLRSNGGTVVGYWYIPHTQIVPVTARSNELISYYEYTPIGGSPRRVEASEIVHFVHGINPEDPRAGIAPMGTVLREICGENGAAAMVAGLMDSAGLTAYAITADGDMTSDPTPDQIDEIKRQFRQNRLDAAPTIVPFRAKIQNIGYKPDEIAPKQLRYQQIAAITAAAGLDMIALGYPSESKTYSNFEQAVEAAWEMGLLPKLSAIASTLTRQVLVPDFGSTFNGLTRVHFDTKDVRALQPDANEERESWGKAFQAGIVKRSDARSALGLPVDDKTDNVYFTDLNQGLTPEQAKVKAQILSRQRAGRQLWEAQGVPDPED